MNKRVHEIAKERGLAPKEVLQRLKDAGIDVKAVSSSVDEETAKRALGNGAPAGAAAPSATAAPAAPAPASAGAAASTPPEPAPDGASGEPRARAEHKQRPTRDSLQGERAPGSAGGRRRVVIDSQASRRNPGAGPPQSSQPPRRQRRGRRRRGVYDEEAESRPSAHTALAEPDATRLNSGSTV